jgi:hypothetical protein
MGFNNRPTNGKPHAETLPLGGVESFENLIGLVADHADALISDRDLNCAGTILFYPHEDFSFPRGRPIHGVERIEGQVQYDLLQLHLLAAQLRPDAPALGIGKLSLRNPGFHRAYGAAERAGEHQEQRESHADDQSIGAPDAVVRQRVCEHETEQSHVDKQSPPALAPKRQRRRE